MTALDRASPLDRLLRLFTDVRTGEGWLAVLLALNVFLILTSYYILKPVRELELLPREGPGGQRDGASRTGGRPRTFGTDPGRVIRTTGEKHR